MSSTKKSPTIVDVARHAGVSPGTVSRVLNDVGGPPETRRRVRDAVATLGYVPNHAARSLKRQATEQIALVVPDIANPVYVQMAKTIQRVAAERGYHLSLVSTENSPLDERRGLESLERRHVDGLILVSLRPSATLVERVQRSADRICIIGGFPEGVPADIVRVDSGRGVVLGVHHLLEQGRARVAMLNGTSGTVPGDRRAEGYRRALAEAAVPLDEALVAEGDFGMESGYRAVDRLLATAPDLDALFCANDAMALGALRRFRELGRDVPGAIAVVGMDDIAMARMSTPTLTSVSLLAAERGRIAAEFLLERLEREGALEPRRATVIPRLVVRESSTAHTILGHVILGETGRG